MVRTFTYFRRSWDNSEIEAERLRHAVAGRGDTVISSFTDDPAILGKGKNAGWKAMLGSLAEADQIVVGSVADLPGRKISDLFKILDVLRDHGVSLRLDQEGIDTDDGATAILSLVAAYRHAKLSEAIKSGQKRARTQGKMIGRPKVPDHIRQRIADALANGNGIRLTARLFNVSPGSVVNIRSSSTDATTVLAA